MTPPTNELRTPTPPVEYATRADLAAAVKELRQDIRVDLAELKADLTRTNQLTLVAMTAIYAGIVTMVKLFT